MDDNTVKQLLSICRDIDKTYGNNSVDFHRAIARLRQFMANLRKEKRHEKAK